MAKPALGRGLGALLGGSPSVGQPAPVFTPQIPAAGPEPDFSERVQRVPLNRIQASSLQPRKDFPEESLRELADSIREQGIVQPLIVRERNGQFELIAGERRCARPSCCNCPKCPSSRARPMTARCWNGR
jgi:ParB family chromosome partitioning protein